MTVLQQRMTVLTREYDRFTSMTVLQHSVTVLTKEDCRLPPLDGSFTDSPYGNKCKFSRPVETFTIMAIDMPRPKKPLDGRR
jgi:hypothetical protein